MNRPSTKETGDLGEAIATKFLREQGMEILETNYRFERGEIDVVGREGEILVFVEVKLRHNDSFGEAEYAITPRKQRQLKRVAEGYINRGESLLKLGRKHLKDAGEAGQILKGDTTRLPRLQSKNAAQALNKRLSNPSSMIRIKSTFELTAQSEGSTY